MAVQKPAPTAHQQPHQVGAERQEVEVAAYLVRLKSNHRIVGFFAVDDEEDLLALVDEDSDPEECEALLLPPGGVMLSSANVPPVPRVFTSLPVGEDDDEPELEPLNVLEEKNEPMLTSDWQGIINGDEDTESVWKDLVEVER